MKKIIVGIVLFSMFFIACKDECREKVENVMTAKESFENAPTSANCLNYQSALQTYLAGTCDQPYGVNYMELFQTYLDDLACDTFPSALPTCNNGVQDGNETGVDCGGDCPPCGTPSQFFFSCDIDGVAWDAYPGTASFDDDPKVNAGYLTGYRAQVTDQITIHNFDDFGAVSTYTFIEGSVFSGNEVAGEASISLSVGQVGTATLYHAVNNQGTLTITAVDSTNNTVSGTFSLDVFNDTAFDTISITNGEFFVPFQ